MYNLEDTAINLSGYFVTDNPAVLTKHPLFTQSDSLIIPANGYLILWSSGLISRGVNHLSFGLSAGGESFSLVAPDGQTVLSSLVFPAQKADVSFGWLNKISDSLVFFRPASFMSANKAGHAYKGFLSDPVFSMPSGFYGQSTEVAISSNTEDVDIFYSIDGSAPNPNNLSGT